MPSASHKGARYERLHFSFGNGVPLAGCARDRLILALPSPFPTLFSTLFAIAIRLPLFSKRSSFLLPNLLNGWHCADANGKERECESECVRLQICK